VSGENAGEDTGKKQVGLLQIVLLVVAFVVIVYIGIALSTGHSPVLSRISGFLFPERIIHINVDEYHFEVGRNRVFADMDGAVAAAGSMGIQVLNAEGHESLNDSLRLETPAIVSNNGAAIAFDLSGTAIRVFNSSEVIASFDSLGPIVSASINENGWFAVSTQEGDGYRGVVRAYNDRGVEVFNFFSGVGYILSAEISSDNRTMAVLRLTETGSQVIFYDLVGGGYTSVFDYQIGIILDIRFISGGSLLAISTESVIYISSSGVGREIFGFEDKRLGRFTFGDDFVIVHLLDFGVGYSGELLRIERNGRVHSELQIDRDIVAMTQRNGYLAVLWSDGPAFLDSNFDEIHHHEPVFPVMGATDFVFLNRYTALAAGEHSAMVIRRY
jgi:hypothetical protein